MKRVYLEICDACNLNCSFCTYPKGNTFLPLSVIDDYTSQIRQFCSYIYLHILGEPLLHPDFEKILDLLDSKDFQLQLVSNGTLLDRYPDLLKHICLRKLSISIHSISRSNVTDHYFETIDRLIEDPHDTKIELRFYNEKTLSDIALNYKKKLIGRYGVSSSKRNRSFLLKENVYLYEEDFFRWPDMNDPIIGDTGTCHGGIDMIAISRDSLVTLCCLDPKAENAIGDLKKETLREILESERYKDTVKAFRERKVLFPLCQRCSYRLRF